MGHKQASSRGPVGRQVDKHAAPPTPTVLISAIQHHAYCPRQCALIHVEQTFEENVFTMRGRRRHARADSGLPTTKGAVRSLRGIPLWSDSLGIRGKADVVEIRPSGPFPVEYKAGKRRIRPTEMQLCAQALCLEEMFGTRVPRGAVYLAGTKRRETVLIDRTLRQDTVAAIAEIRANLLAGTVPDAPNDERCGGCSLTAVCLPSVVSDSARLRGLQGALFVPYPVGEARCTNS